MATSYTNPGGSGDRTAIITATVPSGSFIGSPILLINGIITNETWGFGFVIFRFQFLSAKIIDEIKFYQSDSTSHGTWKCQGSNDGSAWTDIGGTFLLGGTTVQTITTLAGNTTAYIYYQLLSDTHALNSNPYLQEFEFKIDDPVVISSGGEKVSLSAALF